MLYDKLGGNTADGTRLGKDQNEAIEAAMARLDDQMMKRGTLSHAQIDWKAVSRDAEFVLLHYRHINAFSAYIMAGSQSSDPAENDASIKVAEIFFDSYWPEVHPLDDRQMRRKNAKLEEIKQGLAQIALTLHEQENLTDERRACLDALVERAGRKDVDLSVVRKNLLDASAALKPSSPNKSGAQSDTGEAGALDPRARAELRRDVFKLATRIQKHYPADEVAYIMRGFAATLEHGNIPEVDESGKSPVQPMPAHIRDGFVRNLKGGPKAKDLEALEDRLYNSPDWFEGQAIAVQIAEALGFNCAAKAIRDRVAKRLSCHPELRRMQYANSSAYLGEQEKMILEKDCISDADSAAKADEDFVSKIKGAYGEGGVDAALKIADQELINAHDGRSVALIKIELARVLERAGILAMASVLLTELHSYMCAIEALRKWDSVLLEQIEAEMARFS